MTPQQASRPKRCGGPIEFDYDDLIVAAGMRQSCFGHDEFAKFAPGMESISDVLTIRRRVFGAFEMAETSDDPRRTPPLADVRPRRGGPDRR
jgi:NADH dehydrogenase